MSLLGFLFPSKKVMLIEDDAALRKSLAEKFTEKNFRVIEAGDANDVLALIGSEKPDALVLDLILPLKDGISLLEELRGTGYTMPVVILSNLLGSDSLRADAERLGATFFNKSSSTLETIVQAVSDRL